MSHQKEIARLLGVTQATVSMALRGDRSISVETQKKVRDTAEQLGYHHNAYLTALMSNIRSGKKLNDKGTIGLLIEARSQKSWYQIEAYRIFHQGVLDRAKKLGFRVESFFLREPGMNVSKIDRILDARGINGIILAPPYHGNRTLNLHWDRYAAIGVGFGWEKQELHRVVFDHLQNFITAFNELRQLGYTRIGTVMGHTFIQGNRHGSKWYNGYLECQDRTPKKDRIPILISNCPPPGELSEAKNRNLETEFRRWFSKWKPDAVLTLIGKEYEWLRAMKLDIPQDVGLACLSWLPGNNCAGIDEKEEIVGATALELVAAQIARNEFGIPPYPKTTMIEGRWVSGTTVENKN